MLAQAGQTSSPRKTARSTGSVIELASPGAAEHGSGGGGGVRPDEDDDREMVTEKGKGKGKGGEVGGVTKEDFLGGRKKGTAE